MFLREMCLNPHAVGVCQAVTNGGGLKVREGGIEPFVNMVVKDTIIYNDKKFEVSKTEWI